MRAPQRIRRLVERDLSRGPATASGNLTILVGALLAIPPLVLLSEPWSFYAAGLLAGLWFAFVGWRALRMLRASSLRGDRDYDRVAKHLLSMEYRKTESATATKRRKQRHIPDR